MSNIDVSNFNDDVYCVSNNISTLEHKSYQFSDAIRTEVISMVAGLRANSSIQYCVIPEIVQSFNTMSSSMASFVQSESVNSLVHAGISSDDIKIITDDLAIKLKNIVHPLDFLSTRFKQDTFFDNHPLSVKPETIVLGSEMTSHGGRSDLECETDQYVSVQKTL